MGVEMLTAVTTEVRSPQGKKPKGAESTHWGSPPFLLPSRSAYGLFCLPKALERSVLGFSKSSPPLFQCLLSSSNYKVLFETKGVLTFLDGVRLPQVSSISNISLSLSFWVQSPPMNTALFLLKTHHYLPTNNSSLLIQAFQLCPQLKFSLPAHQLPTP